MKISGIVAFIFVFGVIEAYDFEDSIYNRILINEIDELQWDTNKLFSPRYKRHTEQCESKFFRSCCEEDYFRQLYEQDRALKKECYKEVTGKEPQDTIVDLLKCDKSQELKREIGCVAECVARKTGIVDEEGNLKEVETKKSFDEKNSKVEWLAAKSNDIFSKCFPAANEIGKMPREEGQCNAATTKFAHCIWKEIQSSCPADRITDPVKCKKIKENIDSLEKYAS